jgi:hypothetical protein
MIILTQRQHDLLTKTFQEGTVHIHSRGNMIIPEQLVGLGWLAKVGPRAFSLTKDGHNALNEGKIGTEWDFVQNLERARVSLPAYSADRLPEENEWDWVQRVERTRAHP